MPKEVQLEIISYAKLKAGGEEVQRLQRIARTCGLFYIDLGDVVPGGPGIQQSILQAQREFFHRDRSAKVQACQKSEDCYYQHVDDLGVEFLGISRREKGYHAALLPPEIQRVEAEFHTLTEFSDTVLSDISNVLTQGELAEVRRTIGPDKSYIELVRTAAPVDTIISSPHTDDNLLTLMFCDDPITEFLRPNSEEWNTASTGDCLPVVTIGQALANLRPREIHAPSHRVRQKKDAHEAIVYYLHPCAV